MDTRADCGLSEENTQGEGDPEMMALEDITAEAREVEFGWLRSSDPQLHSSYRMTSGDARPGRDWRST